MNQTFALLLFIVAFFLLCLLTTGIWNTWQEYRWSRENERLDRLDARTRRIAELEVDLGIVPLTQGTCAQCQHPLQIGALYCAFCGEPTQQRPKWCQLCKVMVLPEAKFCPHCRASLATRMR